MYRLPKLSYLFQDLEPYIDIHTMGLHYYKHYKGYLNKLNEILIKNNYDYRYSLEELIYHMNEFSVNDRDDILFNLGGVLNHNLYFNSINPNKRSKPMGKLLEYIEKKYGSYDEFYKKIKEMALKLRGSGYTFLVLNSNLELDIINVSNQETPLSFGFIPLFTIDLWEHAYYLNYENERGRYIDNFKEIADYTNASRIFNSVVK